MRKILIKKGIILLVIGALIGSIIFLSSGNELKDANTYKYVTNEFNHGKLAYGVFYDTNEKLTDIVAFDTNNGYAIEDGPLGINRNIRKIAFDKENNQLFYTKQDLESSYLYNCDLETGEATLINESTSGNSIKTIIIPFNWSNQPPDPPEFTGPSYVQPGVNYTFCIRVVDPEGDAVYFLWDWGDGEPMEWFGPYASGDLICFNHSWSEEGTYIIKVKAKDEYGAESDWVTHVIIIDGRVPSIKISKPKRAIYIRDMKIFPFIVPIIFGDIQIWFSAEDSLSGLNRTKLFIDDELKEVFTICPKSWNWNETTPGKYKHVIKLIAYDNSGNNATKKMTVLRFF